MNKAYTSYVPINQKWAKQIPSHWDARRMKAVFAMRKERNNPIVTENILSLTAKQGVVPYTEKEGTGGNKPKSDLTQYNVCHENDLLVNCMNVVSGAAGVSRYHGAISPVYYAFYPHKNENIWYYHYIFRLLPFQRSLVGLGKGILMHESEDGTLTSVRMRISMDYLGNVLLPVPPREEQDQIVRFLDWKVSSINRLINIKKNMIELLENRKKSIINSVLAGGASNSVCKESVIEGLLTIPTTWDERPLKFYASSNDESLSSKTPSNYEFNYIDISTTGFRKLKKEPVCTTFEEAPSRARRIVREGDTILSTVRTYLKAILYIDNTKDGNVVSTGFAVLRPKDGVYPPLLSYALSCDYFINAVIRNSIGVSYPAINEKKLLSLKLALPKSYDEQVKVYEQIMALTESTDITIKYLQDMVNGLQDLKNRLISDTVTGKIDVRSIEIPEYEFVDEDTDADNEDGGEEEIQEQED